MKTLKLIFPFTILAASTLFAGSAFHQAPESSAALANPVGKTAAAVKAGGLLFLTHCASCHGIGGKGSGNIPALIGKPVKNAADGELFWFLEKGSPENGMPPSNLNEKQRWQVISFIRSLSKNTEAPAGHSSTPPPSAGPSLSDSPDPVTPFTDFRFEKPGQRHKILASDLPAPAPNSSVGNGPAIVAKPKKAWPQVPAGFKVQLFANGFDNPRLLRTAPNGDVFLCESDPGKIKVIRGVTLEGKAKQTEVFAHGLNRPYGIAFYPSGKSPEWIYVGDTDAVIRFPYRSGDLKAAGPPQKIISLPERRGHWTRDLQFSLDGKRLFVAVGSASNADDPDTTPAEKNRGVVMVMSPDGTHSRAFASGVRNAGGGLAVHPQSGELWASVNERDGLGDNLVPDYITHLVEGGFYGWPWWYIGGHQDPRHAGKHPELQKELITPDVLLQPHHASLQMLFYEASQFPSTYRGDIFATQHGSWNRSVRTGYELIRIPLHQNAKTTGDYEDFMTGFAVDSKSVWGRPVGVTTASDGCLLVSDDGSNSICRVCYDKKS
jgi:glucose/arabinose dehydrogenase